MKQSVVVGAGELSVSVAMATFNGSRFIRAQLDSIAQQDRRPDELVVTDDGSDDGTLDTVAAFARAASFPVRIHRNKTRLGYRHNFMRAISLCRSDLVAFSDQDDVWHADKLSRAIALFADPDMLLVHHDAYLLRDGGSCSERLGKPIDPPALLLPMQNPAWAFSQGFTQVVHRSLAQFGQFWPHSVCRYDPSLPDSHDRWFFFLASVLGHIGFIDRPLADYRQHDSNLFGVKAIRRGPADRIRARLENRTTVFGELAHQSRARAGIMAALAELPGLDGRWQERALVGALRFEQLAALYQRRRAVYESPTLRGRLHHFRQLVDAPGYNPRGSWHFGRRALVKDAVLGAMLGPVTLRYGARPAGGDPFCFAGIGRETATESVQTVACRPVSPVTESQEYAA